VEVVSEDEIFTYEVNSGPTGGNPHFSPNFINITDFGTATIRNTGIFTTRLCKYFVMENAGRVVIPVFRSAGQNGAATVAYETLSGSAVEGVDFHRASGVISFNDGEVESELHVEILDDLAVENPNESFFIKFSQGGQTPISIAQPVIEIEIVNDFDAGCVDFGRSEYTFSESVPNDHRPTHRRQRDEVIKLHRDREEGEVMVVLQSSDGTARGSEDYQDVFEIISFRAGESTKNVTVTILDDDFIESPNEAFSLRVTEYSGTKQQPVCLGSRPDLNIHTNAESDEVSILKQTVSTVTIGDDGDFTVDALSAQLKELESSSKDACSSIPE